MSWTWTSSRRSAHVSPMYWELIKSLALYWEVLMLQHKSDLYWKAIMLSSSEPLEPAYNYNHQTVDPEILNHNIQGRTKIPKYLFETSSIHLLLFPSIAHIGYISSFFVSRFGGLYEASVTGVGFPLLGFFGIVEFMVPTWASHKRAIRLTLPQIRWKSWGSSRAKGTSTTASRFSDRSVQ